MLNKKFALRNSMNELYVLSEPTTGETYNDGTYKYIYDGYFGEDEKAVVVKGQGGWGVQLDDKSSTAPVTKIPLNEIHGYPVVNLSYMFSHSNAESINLEAETSEQPVCQKVFANNFGSHAITMVSMFEFAKAKNITLPVGFGTEANNMQKMFASTRVNELIFSEGFGQKVVNTMSMFAGARIKNMVFPEKFGFTAALVFQMFACAGISQLTLPKEFTQHYSEVERMFKKAKIEIVYVKNQKEADKLKGLSFGEIRICK